MRITVAYKLSTEPAKASAGFLAEKDVRRICSALADCSHEVTPVEVSGAAAEVVERLLDSEPDLVFNLAGGPTGSAGEAFFPELYDQLRLPFAGNGGSLVQLTRNRALARTVFATHGFAVPNGKLVTASDRGLTVPFLEAFPGQALGIVEHDFGARRKQGGAAPLTDEEEKRVLETARKVFAAFNWRDLGCIHVRLDDAGRPFVFALDALPGLHPAAPLTTAARRQGLDLQDILRLIVRSAANRCGLALSAPMKPADDGQPRPTARELGIRTGRLPTGIHNAITDVPGVRVGHSTRIEDDVPVPSSRQVTAVRTGVTAVIPAERPFLKPLVAGAFVLSGIGEMTGLMQILELGWLETPILLTNSHSVGPVHDGVISHLRREHPDLGTALSVALPVVGETDDSFLNDVRVGLSSAADAERAIDAAESGPVPQGSVGAGTGMMTFDFAGGIGTSSRILEIPGGPFTMGVLVQSNFGKMRNLTVDGLVAGRYLDHRFDPEGRRKHSDGSVIVVLATDVPLLSRQLNRIAKRAALGLGRAGSHATTLSGEIVLAFSTANRAPERTADRERFIDLECLDDAHIDLLYETAIETTEEAVLNAIFCSGGMSGRDGRIAPAIPTEIVLERLQTRGGDHGRH